MYCPTLVICFCVFVGSSEVIDTAPPSFSFDFDSLMGGESARDQIGSMRSDWSSFFSDRPKPAFSDKVTNVVKGSENQLRGSRN
jgi:hypothetical protein